MPVLKRYEPRVDEEVEIIVVGNRSASEHVVIKPHVKWDAHAARGEHRNMLLKMFGISARRRDQSTVRVVQRRMELLKNVGADHFGGAPP